MNDELHLIKRLAEAIDAGRPAAFLTVISAGGSTPREAGAKMLVYGDGSTEGTIGGGSIEALAIRQALKCLGEGAGGKFSFALKPEGNTGMICMGDMEVFIDVYRHPLKVLLLGGGHVALKIAEACRLAGYPYAVADDRAEFASPARYPDAAAVINKPPHEAVAAAGVDKDTYVVIVTRGHALDRECLEAALATPAAYIGMIGSRKKVGEIFRRLEEKKLFPLKDPRVHSPIGLNIGGKAPGEIAVSVMAEIIQTRYGKDGAQLRLKE